MISPQLHFSDGWTKADLKGQSICFHFGSWARILRGLVVTTAFYVVLSPKTLLCNNGHISCFICVKFWENLLLPEGRFGKKPTLFVARKTKLEKNSHSSLQSLCRSRTKLSSSKIWNMSCIKEYGLMAKQFRSWKTVGCVKLSLS